ncbi:LacI family DNA-binding transcriptional regulator [Microbacterium sp. MYb62]|uniref:LacI family DNA-binding transcriptional regulator n=1 Tax=Microbacterium sp. MYb62 TaxID=1848690 RepID=UPI00215769B7|nr:LacI family DNA-binding transcriptional regulator [Microbacterium sp. MYb62]
MTTSSKNAASRPTLRMVADEAGVSAATASYVLSGRRSTARGPGASEATRERIKEAAQRLGYVPNQAARGIRTGNTQVIQLSLSMLSDPWSLAVAEAVNTAGRERDLETMILADGDWYRALERRPSDVAFLDSVPDTPLNRERLRTLASHGQRLVVFSETIEPEGFDVIRSDAAPGGAIAADRLLAAHEDIACLTAASVLATPPPNRLTGFQHRLQEHGVRHDWIAAYDGGEATAFAAAMTLLTSSPRPTAIYATTDFAAIATIHAAHRLGLSVPRDVAVIGLGNTPAGELTSPTLTTIGPLDLYSRLADTVVALATGERVPGTLHEFPWALISRESA